MVMTQWYDILAFIGAVFAAFSTLLVLVVYLEQWLAQPDTASLGAPAEREPAQQDDREPQPWAPDPVVEVGTSHLRRIKARDFERHPQAARISVHLHTGLTRRVPPNAGGQPRQ
jgi:hypothetical protein